MGKYQSIDLDTKISQLVNLCEKITTSTRRFIRNTM